MLAVIPGKRVGQLPSLSGVDVDSSRDHVPGLGMSKDFQSGWKIKWLKGNAMRE